MSQQVLCEECDTMITLPKLKVKVHKGLLHEHYFNCPECNYKYISYCTDQKIRRDIKRQEKRREQFRKQQTIYDQLLTQVDSFNKNKNDILTEQEMQVVSKLEQSQSEIRRIEAEINMQDKLIKKDMDRLKKRITKTLT